MLTLELTPAQAKALLATQRDRRRRAEKGLVKYAESFDETLGANLRRSRAMALELEQKIGALLDDCANVQTLPRV